MAHTHPVVDSDSRFVINSTTREISTTSDKLELIQGDHQSERITFEIPRIVEGHDMSLSDRIEVHYINIDRKTNATSRDIYIIDDAAVDGDKLTFSWLISGNATKYYGRLNFIILFECLDPDGNYTYKWNTEICKLLTIGESISNTSAVIEDHSDILEKFKKEFLEYVDSKQDMLIQSGASVGQIAKITAVDNSGKPTAWEAVDMPSGGGSTVELDTTLTQSGKAADAKAVGDALENCVTVEEIDQEGGQGEFIPLLSADGTEYRFYIGNNGIPAVMDVNGRVVWTGTSGGSGGSGGDTDVGWVDGEKVCISESTIITGEYVNKMNGAFLAADNWSRTDFISCAGAAQLKLAGISLSWNNSDGYNAFYGMEKNFIGRFNIGLIGSNPNYIDIPDGACYFVISYVTNDLITMNYTIYATAQEVTG